MKNFFVFLFLCPAVMGFAQTDFRAGFVVTLERDTVSGEIDYRSNLRNYRVCRFRKDGEIKEFNPAELTGYGYNNDKYFSAQVVEGSFAEVIINGELSLYRLGEVFYLRKSGDKLHKLEAVDEKVIVNGNEVVRKNNNRWRGIVIYVTSDCPSDLHIPKTLDLSERSLSTIVNRYNQCKGGPQTVYKEKKPWAHVEPGISAGWVQSTISMSSSTPFLSDRYQTTSPYIGLTMAISLPRVSEKLAFQPEVHFSKSSYTAHVVRSTSSNTSYYDTSIDLKTISMPLTLRYSPFPGRKYMVHLLAGFNFDFQRRSSTRAFVESVSDNTTKTWEIKSFDVDGSQVGYGGGLMLSRAFGKIDTALVARYFSMNNLSDTPDVTGTTRKLLVSVQLSRK